MVIETILFPAPNPPHYTLESHGNHLFWMPVDDNRVQTPKIPCMLYSPNNNAQYFLIFCHGNGCDIGSRDGLLRALCHQINSHILAFEYPTYGLCRGSAKLDRSTIDKHAECAYKFVCETLRWPTDRILMYGHSIGSGPACHIASTKPVGALILQSPYTSINTLIQEKVGFLGYLLGNSYWNNLNAMQNIHCPTLFIHGEQDNLIPLHHPQTLHDSLTHIKNKQLILVPNADHGSIPDAAVIHHLESFLRNVFSPPQHSLPSIEINSDLRTPPAPHEELSIFPSISTLFTPLSGFTTASINVTRSALYSVIIEQPKNNGDTK